MFCNLRTRFLTSEYDKGRIHGVTHKTQSVALNENIKQVIANNVPQSPITLHSKPIQAGGFVFIHLEESGFNPINSDITFQNPPHVIWNVLGIHGVYNLVKALSRNFFTVYKLL